MIKKIIFSIFFLLTIYFLFADIIILKDKTVIKGKIIERSMDQLIIKTDYGKMIINRSEIAEEYENEEQYNYEKNNKDSKTDNPDLIKLKKESGILQLKLFWAGFATSCLSPFFIMPTGASIPYEGMVFTVFTVAFVTSGIGAIPYGGPVALSFIYSVLSICSFAVSSQFSGFIPFLCPLGAVCMIIASLETLAAIFEITSKSRAENYYLKNRKKLNVFIYPDLPLNKIEETSIVGGFTYRF